ncbi:KR domain-containing protein [Chromobacterium sphagni]|uniref:Ketoreductase (KR) domain-containing protein n=1 Tax=Chromobacterium sphagni TaxID=1903179 RepID=A0ABX3C6X1_9NEIS|nr:KR domain-containing protein [Chromobacterium sphagni]OHX11184.1 hypothetical protein BI344_22280 [Chromobacterium sphagni]
MLGALARDDEFDETIDKWVARKKLGKLLELWVAGLEIDWSRLYGARPPRRISLPTYPFARERYWLPELGAAAATPPAPALAQPAALLEGEEYWQAAAAGPAVDVERLTLLHFCDDDAESAQLAQRLRRPLLQIRSGDATRRLGPQRYQAAGCDEAAFDALFALLKADGAAAGGYGVLYRWAEGQPRLPALRAVLRAAVGASLPLRYLQLSGRLEAGALGSCHDLSQIGFERSLGLTLPQLDVGVLFGDAGGLSVEQIAAEWGRPGVTRYQGGERQRLAWRPLAAEAAPALSPLRSRGVYLISGGGGGLGELFAGHLAQRCQGRIALLGRRPADAGMEARLARLRRRGPARRSTTRPTWPSASRSSG